MTSHGDPLIAIITEVVGFVGPAFAVAGYALVVGFVLLERSILLGFIVPGDIVLALGGVYASRGDLTLVWVIVLAAIAGSIGESAGYWLGRRYGRSAVARLPFSRSIERRLGSVERHFDARGGVTVALGRYASEAGTFVPFVAGMAKMPYRRFIAWDLPSVVVWATGVPIVGYVFGRNLETVDRILSRFGWVVLAVLVVYFGVRAWRHRRHGTRGKRNASASR